jgi:hypothetical protein
MRLPPGSATVPQPGCPARRRRDQSAWAGAAGRPGPGPGLARNVCNRREFENIATLGSLQHVEKVAFSSHPFFVASYQRMIIRIVAELIPSGKSYKAYPILTQFACAGAAGRRRLPARRCMRDTSPVVDATTAPTRRPGGGGGGGHLQPAQKSRRRPAGYWQPALPRQPPAAGRRTVAEPPKARSCRRSRRRGGAVAKAAGGCGCFVAEAGRVAGRGAEAAGC